MNQRLRTALRVLIFGYVIALATSMAGMEILAWTTFAVVVGRRAAFGPRPSFPLAGPLLGLAAVVAWTLYSAPPLKPFLDQFGFMRWIILYWSFGWALEDVWDENFERSFVRHWMMVIAAVAAYVTLQFFTGVDWLRSSHHFLEKQGAVWRAPGCFSNVLTFAYAVGTAYFAVLLPFRRLTRGRWVTPVALLGALVTIVPLVRGAVIAAAAAALSYAALARRKLIPYYVGAVATLVTLLALISPKIMDNLRGHLENSANERVHLWRAYARMFGDHPWTGVGLFQGDKLLPETYARLGITEPFTSHAHNVILQWAGGAGGIALGLYLIISFYFARAAWRLRDQTPWGWSLLMAQVYHHVGGLTEANFFDAEVNHAVIFTWALITVLTRRAPGRTS